MFTYQIWGERHKNTSDKNLIKAGRIFTLAFGIVIILLALLIPFMGGSEKVVVTILTMVIAPLFIPSVWGLFSRRITGRQAIWAMCITYALGITLKYTAGDIVNNQVLEATVGLLIPVFIMTVMEIRGRIKGYECNRYNEISKLTDPEADTEPDAQTKQAVKSYSFMAISCFCATLASIGLLLVWLLMTDENAANVRYIMTVSCWIIAAITCIYITYRLIDSCKSKSRLS